MIYFCDAYFPKQRSLANKSFTSWSDMLHSKTLQLENKKIVEYIRVDRTHKWRSNLSNQACFIYWMSGQSTLFTPDSIINTTGKESLLLKCGAAYIDRVMPEGNDVTAVIVHFYPELLKRIFFHEFPTVFRTDPAGTIKEKTKYYQDHLIRKYVEGLLFYIENPELADNELLLLKIKELILLLSKTGQSQTVEEIFTYMFTPEEHDFKKVIETHVYTDLSVKELAYLTNRSLATFKRDFQRHYNEAPAHYLKAKKIARAAQLLSTTSMRIREIALECGLSTGAHLTRLFQQTYRTTPREYRLSHYRKTLDQIGT
jgi:AraC-like DNA-binding protein